MSKIIKIVVVVIVVALGTFFFYGCSEDNDEIRASADDTFRYTHFTYEGGKMPKAELHFINEYTHKPMKWAGSVGDMLVYLEQLDKGKCYKNPIDRGQAVEVDCE